MKVQVQITNSNKAAANSTTLDMTVCPTDTALKVQEQIASVTKTFSFADQQLRFNGQGLPSDELCVQNGILVTRSARWPLCVDPQMQVVQWIKKKEEKAGITVKTFNDDYIKLLELAVQYGKPFLFENLDEELDPMIDPVLEKRYIVVSGQKLVTLGDNQVEWSDSFSLMLTTKLSNPKYSPEVMGKVSIVNCVITLEGLASQLLNVVVGFERPDLEELRQKLVQQMSENRQIIKGLEDTLLRELAASKASEGGKEVMAYKRGDYFGELALISTDVRQATVVANGSVLRPGLRQQPLRVC